MNALFANRFVNRITHKALFGLAMLLCMAWSAANAWRAPTSLPSPASSVQECPAPSGA